MIFSKNNFLFIIAIFGMMSFGLISCAEKEIIPVNNEFQSSPTRMKQSQKLLSVTSSWTFPQTSCWSGFGSRNLSSAANKRVTIVMENTSNNNNVAYRIENIQEGQQAFVVSPRRSASVVVVATGSTVRVVVTSSAASQCLTWQSEL